MSHLLPFIKTHIYIIDFDIKIPSSSCARTNQSKSCSCQNINDYKQEANYKSDVSSDSKQEFEEAFVLIWLGSPHFEEKYRHKIMLFRYY